MKMMFCAVTLLCAIALLGGCAQTPTTQGGTTTTVPTAVTTTVTATTTRVPWTTVSTEQLPSYETYFSEIHTFDEWGLSAWAEYQGYTPKVTDEGVGMEAYGTATATWFVEVADDFVPVQCDDRYIYGVEGGKELVRVDYYGKERTVLFCDESGKIAQYAGKSYWFYLAENTLFFPCGTTAGVALQRVYLPSGTVDTMAEWDEELPSSYRPISNWEIVWQVEDPAFDTQLEALLKDETAGLTGTDEEKREQVIVLLEERGVYSYVEHYYNAKTREKKEKGGRVFMDNGTWWQE